MDGLNSGEQMVERRRPPAVSEGAAPEPDALRRNPKVIREPEFASRLTSACEQHPYCPAPNFGRLGWIRTQFAERFGEKVSVETARKWTAGEVKPRPDKLALLAQLLEVDEAWLSLGVAPDMSPRERKVRDASVDGAVNLVAGLIQMSGGHPAFPEDGDARAETDYIDMYAIIRGAQYALHVLLAEKVADGWRFAVPTKHAGVRQIGVIQVGDMDFQLVEISSEAIKTGSRKGASIQVVLDDDAIDEARIESFRNRL